MVLAKPLVLTVLLTGFMTQAARPDAIASGTSADAYIDLGAGPYPDASAITTGNARAWYQSSEIESFFGGTPNVQRAVRLR